MPCRIAELRDSGREVRYVIPVTYTAAPAGAVRSGRASGRIGVLVRRAPETCSDLEDKGHPAPARRRLLLPCRGVCAQGPDPSPPSGAVNPPAPHTSHTSLNNGVLRPAWPPSGTGAMYGSTARLHPPGGPVIEIVYDGQDHHEDCMYSAFGDPEPCSCKELTADEVWPQEPDQPDRRPAAPRSPRGRSDASGPDPQPFSAGPGGVLVGPADGGVDQDFPLDDPLCVCLDRQLLQDADPCFVDLPPPEHRIRRLPGAVSLGQVPPGRAGPGPPPDPAEDCRRSLGGRPIFSIGGNTASSRTPCSPVRTPRDI